jgi:aspartyl-tRNA(Asn)/glutamyl-tRNA(Gln) amidotransferase subunit B
MNEGSMRCDVNLSVRKKGETKLGTRTEMKNLNSFQFIVKAIEYEFKRQVDEIEAGGAITQETRRYDPASGKTFSMRSKENANDYRYFPDPDLPPIALDEETIRRLADSLGELPDAQKARCMEAYSVTSLEAEALVENKHLLRLFEEAYPLARNAKLLLHFVISDLAALTGDDGECPLSAEDVAELSNLVDDGSVNTSTARRVLKDAAQQNEASVAIVGGKISSDKRSEAMAVIIKRHP